MKVRLSALIMTFSAVTACSDASAPEITQIEMRRSGWVATDVIVYSTGRGRYHISEPMPVGTDGEFMLSKEQFSSLLSNLEPYRAQAERYSDASAMRFTRGTCPSELPRSTDNGTAYIRWMGKRYDAHFLMDFGCDAKRHSERNAAMHRVIESLPLPKK